MPIPKPVRESVLKATGNLWVIGEKFLLSRQPTAPMSACCWSDGAGWFFTISEPPETRQLSPTSPLQLVHDAGDFNAARQIGEAFLKVQVITVLGRTREHTTLSCLHDPANSNVPTFPIPRVLYHGEFNN